MIYRYVVKIRFLTMLLADTLGSEHFSAGIFPIVLFGRIYWSHCWASYLLISNYFLASNSYCLRREEFCVVWIRMKQKVFLHIIKPSKRRKITVKKKCLNWSVMWVQKTLNLLWLLSRSAVLAMVWIICKLCNLM